jgi:hypothetical protein
MISKLKKYNVHFIVETESGSQRSIIKEIELEPSMANVIFLRKDKDWSRMLFPGCKSATVVFVGEVRQEISNKNNIETEYVSKSKIRNKERDSVKHENTKWPFIIRIIILIFKILKWVLKTLNKIINWLVKLIFN